MKEVTMIYADAHHVECPYCGEHQEGWTHDPTGTTDECDDCGKTYKISEHADVELRG